jgi:hypothetical protein
MASGLPVAAYPVAGPLDVVGDSGAGVLDDDLAVAIVAALRIPRAAALTQAQGFSWAAAATQFEAAILSCAQAHTRRAGRQADLDDVSASSPGIRDAPCPSGPAGA